MALTVLIESWNGLPSHVGATPCVARKSLQFHRVALSPPIRLGTEEEIYVSNPLRPGDASEWLRSSSVKMVCSFR